MPRLICKRVVIILCEKILQCSETALHREIEIEIEIQREIEIEIEIDREREREREREKDPQL